MAKVYTSSGFVNLELQEDSIDKLLPQLLPAIMQRYTEKERPSEHADLIVVEEAYPVRCLKTVTIDDMIFLFDSFVRVNESNETELIDNGRLIGWMWQHEFEQTLLGNRRLVFRSYADAEVEDAEALHAAVQKARQQEYDGSYAIDVIARVKSQLYGTVYLPLIQTTIGYDSPNRTKNWENPYVVLKGRKGGDDMIITRASSATPDGVASPILVPEQNVSDLKGTGWVVAYTPSISASFSKRMWIAQDYTVLPLMKIDNSGVTLFRRAAESYAWMWSRIVVRELLSPIRSGQTVSATMGMVQSIISRANGIMNKERNKVPFEHRDIMYMCVASVSNALGQSIKKLPPDAKLSVDKVNTRAFWPLVFFSKCADDVYNKLRFLWHIRNRIKNTEMPSFEWATKTQKDIPVVVIDERAIKELDKAIRVEFQSILDGYASLVSETQSSAIGAVADEELTKQAIEHADDGHTIEHAEEDTEVEAVNQTARERIDEASTVAVDAATDTASATQASDAQSAGVKEAQSGVSEADDDVRTEDESVSTMHAELSDDELNILDEMFKDIDDVVSTEEDYSPDKIISLVNKGKQLAQKLRFKKHN